MSDSNKIKIQSILSDLFNKHRYIFWYDTDGAMEEFVSTICIESVEVLILDGNPFGIKYRMLCGEPQPERGYLIYSKSEKPANEDNWLLDFQEEGTIFAADMASIYAAECNIPFELKASIVEKHLDFFKTAKNRSKCATMVHARMSAKDIIDVLLSITTGCAMPTYDQLTFVLADECINEESEILNRLEKYNLDGYYWQMVKEAFGYDKAKNIKSLILVLFQDELNSIIGHGTLTNEAHIFMHDWRDSRQYGEMYKKWAEQLETELNIMHQIQGEPLDKLVRIETFPCVDKVIALHLQKEVNNDTIQAEKVETIVDSRRNKLFSDTAQHTMLALLEARRLFEDIEMKMNGLNINTAEEGFMLYINKLYTIDQHYRHYFREANQAESHNLLADITHKVEQVYTNTFLSELIKKWQPLVDAMDQWYLEYTYPQRSFYNVHIHPLISKGKRTFVIISDALRYETMKELQQRIAHENRMECTMKDPMLGVQPSFTQLGMAALLPHRELSFDKQSDEVFADGRSTKGTDNRTKVLQNIVARSIAIKADDLLAIPNGRNWVKDYDLVYIYSNTIDKVGDSVATEKNVFKATEDEMDKLLRLVRYIRDANGANIFITSDHGYIYQNETLDESDFTDFKAQGATCFIENRRFVIGTGLWDGNGAKSWKSEQVGVKAGVDIQICKGINRIRKQGAGSRFIHGGSMLQEIVIPVLHVNIKKTKDVSNVDVDILGKQSNITTASLSVKFYQVDVATEKNKGVTLRMGFYDATGDIISDSEVMTFDSESNDSQMREQKHTFRFKNMISKLNGQEVTLRMERQIENTDQYAPYKEETYKVKVMFEAEW